MAVPANTSQTYSRVGIREDLSDLISNLSRKETPFCTAIGTGPMAKNTLFEWQTDELKAPNGDNKKIEGDDAALEDAPPTTRLNNQTQIMDKTAVTSGTANAVNTAGRAREHSYQIVKRSKELKRDMEARFVGSYAKAAGGAGIARETAGAEAWIGNSSRGAGGADPALDGSNIPTDGAQRAFTEAMLRDVQKKCWENGGTPDLLMVGPFNKGVVSSFAGIATQYRENSGVRPGTILGTADVYVGEFGEIKVVPSYIQRDRSGLLIEPGRWKKRFLRKPSRKPLAKTGDSTKDQIILEAGLECSAPAASGIIADLTTA